jgi:hypothetical protein
LLNNFIELINRVIHNEDILDKFKTAEMKKVEVKAKVLEFRRKIQEIPATL